MAQQRKTLQNERGKEKLTSFGEVDFARQADVLGDDLYSSEFPRLMMTSEFHATFVGDVRVWAWVRGATRRGDLYPRIMNGRRGRGETNV